MDKNKPDLVSKYVNELTVKQVENLLDAEIMGFRMERPNHKGQYGFMLTPKYFKSDEHFSEIFSSERLVDDPTISGITVYDIIILIIQTKNDKYTF